MATQAAVAIQGSEEKLIRAGQRGDHQAVETLFRRYQRPLFQTALRVLGNTEDAEDALQDGLLSAYRNLKRFEGRSQFSTWLTRIVINGKDYPVVSSDYTLKGKSEGASTAKKVGGIAAAGAIIGAIAGGGKGAAIGAAAGAATGAGVQVLTKGAQVKVPSETVLEFRLQQPVTVTPTQS
jgi:hypothetical protein